MMLSSSRFTRLALAAVFILASVVSGTNCDDADCGDLVAERTLDLSQKMESVKMDITACEAQKAQDNEKFEAERSKLEQDLQVLKNDMEKKSRRLAQQLEEQKALFLDTKDGLTAEIGNYKKLLRQSEDTIKQSQEELAKAMTQIYDFQNRKIFGVNFSAVSRRIVGLWKRVTRGRKISKEEEL